MTSALMAFLHHLAAFTLTGSILYELVTFRKDLTPAEARRIQRMDMAYGVSAALILIVGPLRVFYYEKGAPFHAQNLFFWTKMAGLALAAIAIILLSAALMARGVGIL
jgi:putative membrane protein